MSAARGNVSDKLMQMGCWDQGWDQHWGALISCNFHALRAPNPRRAKGLGQVTSILLRKPFRESLVLHRSTSQGNEEHGMWVC